MTSFARRSRTTRGRRGAGIVALTGTLLLAAGCITLSKPAPPTREYVLDYTAPTAAGTPLPIVLRVPPFAVAAAYDHTPIVYRQDTYAIGDYFYQRWASNPGDMVADLLARDFAASGLYRAVQHGPSVLPADYQLTGFVEEIEERRTDATCTAHLTVRILLTRLRLASGDPILLRTTYTADEPSSCGEALALARAMSTALAHLSQQLQDAVYTAIAKDSARG